MSGEVPAILRQTLRAGTVYYAQLRALTSPEPHYLIVVNRNPLGQGILLFVVASSKVENVRRRRAAQPPETLVEINPTDYTEFTKPSIVDCNAVFRMSLQELVDRWSRNELAPKNDLPQSLLARIREGVKLSPLVEEEAKDLI